LKTFFCKFDGPGGGAWLGRAVPILVLSAADPLDTLERLMLLVLAVVTRGFIAVELACGLNLLVEVVVRSTFLVTVAGIRDILIFRFWVLV
jgi:hypothetical protein